MNIILSHFQIDALLQAHLKRLEQIEVSTDLGLTTSQVKLTSYGVEFPGFNGLSWEAVHSIKAAESHCFQLSSEGFHPIQVYSEEYERSYSLYPTRGAPTMLVSGIPMHRIKDTDPYQDTLEKIRAAKPLVGQVLDTCTGLGYTAIEASKTAAHVTTIELDPAALEIARHNPWSQALFDNPKITQLIGDSFEVVMEMSDASYTVILHDPPAFSLAGDLYSAEFYRHLYRLLRNNGRLFHYVGDPESKSGKNITASVSRRLADAGFRQVRRAPRAFGMVAIK